MPEPEQLKRSSVMGVLIRAFIAITAFAAAAAFAYNVHKYYFLTDDAFISFRYARHLVDGLGLVWNPGERVEGYTNFLWTLIMAGGMSVHVEPDVLSSVLGIASGFAILVLLFLHSLKRFGKKDLFVAMVPLSLAVCRSFTAFSTSGLETAFFSLLLLFGYMMMLRERRQNRPYPWASSLILSLATFTRPEGGIFMAAAGMCFLADVLLKKRRLRSLMIWCVPYVLLVGGHFLWRYSYYGYWLPNTFYAKVNGIWLAKSAQYFTTFFSDYKIQGFLPLLLLAVAVRRDFQSFLFLLSSALYLGYLVCIGGDFLGFRFLVPVMPLLFWLTVDGARVIFEFGRSGKRLAIPSTIISIGLVVTFVLTVHFGSVSFDRPKIRHGNETVQISKKYGTKRIEQGKSLRELIEEGILPPDLRIETGGVGALPYYTGWYTQDKHGLNDAFLAHQPIKRHSQIAHEHNASLTYVKKKKIAVYMVGNILLYNETASTLPWVMRRLERLLRQRYNRRNKDKSAELRLVCLVPGEGKQLIFATNMEDSEFEKVLGHLRNCEL